MFTFVINMRDAASRRTFMETQLDHLKIPFEFFDGIDGREYMNDPHYYDDKRARELEDRSLSPGEVGCALSHSAVYAEIVRRGLPWALVLEDDAILHHDLPGVLDALENNILKQGDLVFLERCDHYRWGSKKALLGDFALVEPILVGLGNNAQAAGYVVTAKAADAMQSVNIPVHFPADNWGYYKGLVHFVGVVPSLTLIRQNTSFYSQTAQGERVLSHRNSILTYLWYGFKVYTPVGRFLKHKAKRFLGRE